MSSPDSFTIHTVDKTSLSKTRKLLDLVFPHQSPLERISLWMYGKRGTRIYRIVSFLARADLLVFWIALDADGEALGISGLYRTRKDHAEALWLGWYGVHPKARGKGIGGAMLRHAIGEARQRGAAFLRLYTSVSDDIEGSEDAQAVYEKYGLGVKKRTRLPAGIIADKEGIRVIRLEKIIREMAL